MDTRNKSDLLAALKNGLIVSCQAEPDEPLGKPEILAALAQAAVQGGAAGIRACYPENIGAVRKAVDVPVIGIIKKQYPDSPVFITATVKDALAVAAAKPDIIALDATGRVRPGGVKLSDIVHHLHSESSSLLMADIAAIEDAEEAVALGFDIIGTTLSGYTDESYSIDPYVPDFRLIEELVKRYGKDVSVFAEGRIWEPQQARKALDLGAHAVVVGSAITRPALITERFVKAIHQK